MSSSWRRWTPWLAGAGVALAAVLVLRLENRPWWCACGDASPISINPHGPHNSQHLFDPYSLTHLVKGMLYCGLLAWLFPKGPWSWRLVLVAGLEAAWEMIENSPLIIERYRSQTIAQGYQGDSILNSLCDMVSCSLGFLLARRLGFWWSAALIVTTELVLLVAMRDNLTLSTVTIFVPLDAVKKWQTGG